MKIGIVGMGSIGQRHAENARKLGHEVKVYDPALPSRDFGREAYLYDWCDAAVICTPSAFHESGLRACVERGKHCLIEKPISVGTGQLEILLKVADQKHLTVMMGNNLRFHPCVIRAKDYIDSGATGELHWANFICATEQTSTALRDGVILNSGAHEVDVAIHLLGPVVNILAATTSQDISAQFVLRHESGARSTFHLDIDTADRVRQFWVSGHENSYLFDLDERSVMNQHKFGGTYADDYVAELEEFFYRIAGGHGGRGATGWDGLECLLTLLDIKKKAGQ